MKTANPVEKDNKSHQSKGKKQSPKDSVVIPLSEVDVVRTQTQQSQRNGSVGAASGLQNIYDQGSEIMNGKFQNSLAKTGDINHPQTKVAEKSYMATTSIDQARDYNDGKSGTYLPKTVQEQAVAYQGSKNSTGVSGTVKQATAKSTSGKSGIVPMEQPKSLPEDDAVEMNSEVKTPVSAKDNPGFMELSGNINTTAKLQKRHESAPKASNDAQAAAPSPSNERESMAQAGQVNVMDEQKPGTFSKDEFKALLTAKIKGIKLPANEAEADEFEKNNNIQEVNKNAMGDVKNEKNAASHDIADATAKKPDITGQPVRPVAKMPTPNVGKAPGTPSVAKAMPVKRDAASVEKPIQEQTASIDSEMKANGVTDSMLANSNEPSFTKALAEKNNAKTQSAAATQQFRKTEGSELAKTKEEAQSQAVRQISGMHSARKGGLDHAHGEQKQTATKDSQKRKEIADHINSIYNSSKTDVDGILNNLDKSVAEKFDRGSKAAKKAFEDHIDKEMDAYKLRRYGRAGMTYGAMAALTLVVWDKLTGLPDEVNKYFDSGKKLYIKVMDRYIDDIATHVTTQLNAAKTRIAKGKKDVQTYVNSLSPSLRKIGKEAITEIQNKFNALEESVNNKKDALIDTLAKKYADNVAGIDARITELKSQNSGLINKALDVLKTSVFAIIIEIKNTLTNLLSGVIEAIQAIITDPIGFFRNLIAGVSQGFTNFGANIWTHLKTGFFGWLTGAMKGISLTMPEDVFSLKGVFSITTQVLGLTWNGIRAIGARVIGEPVMKVLETGFEMVQVVRKEGVAGLWEHLKDQFADLKETVMDAIMDIIQNQVIQAGIKWVMGLLTPVGAFIKAAMAIIDVVKFFIQRAAQIMELVKAFTDSIKAIASGNVGAVAKAIENALGKAVPVLIGFLASLLGIGGLADKVVGVIRKIRQRIENAIVKFWNFVKGKARGLLGKFGIGGKKNKDKKEKKVEDKNVKEKYDDRNDSEKRKDLQDGLAAASTFAKKPEHGIEEIENELPSIQHKYGMQQLKMIKDKIKGDEFTIHFYGKVNPEGESPKEHKEYKPMDITFRVTENNLVTVSYHYAPVAHHAGVRDFVITFKLLEGRKVSQTFVGKNLALKLKGTRGVVVSAGKLAQEDYDIELNSAHGIADWFMGSGYKKALNLILTSKEFNQQTMKKAETQLQQQIVSIAQDKDNEGKRITFDITINAIFEVLEEDKLIGGLKIAYPNMTELQTKIMKQAINAKQAPRRCESVDYVARLYDENGKRLGTAESEVEHGDIWLDKLFNK
ncbi:hypothetical protein SAMN05421786_101416 [Chryseobacterium ureilyticum]|uniref:Phage-related protein n=1 Tax=Chryseobacterium ureilyticum TaxID=373668 RepID=A0A1N7KEH6_9FLAO|nr:hypothetical protein [Chryseobacterium ureilyticum]SIS59977.1 hypothetical protein SAMN05421786_101416 [Chryseobacterium ureilyticum]